MQKQDIESVSMNIIARIYTDFPTKFGIPRQSGLADDLPAKIVFEPKYRSKESLRGLTEFSHLWLIWYFSESANKEWSPTVRPPRLGGNKRMGVFATRSPFRPNAIGLSSVKLLSVEHSEELGSVLYVSGADMMSGTPIFDIKPYLSFSDSHPEAVGGFSDRTLNYSLEVYFPPELLERIPTEKRAALTDILSQDPRPSYHDDPDRVYGFPFAGKEIKFTVSGGVMRVCSVENADSYSR